MTLDDIIVLANVIVFGASVVVIVMMDRMHN
jgi:hypothetical protein